MIPKILSKKSWVSFAVLIVVMGLTMIAAIYTKNDLEKKSEREFAMVCNEIEAKISSCLFTHAQFLRSGASLFAVSDSVTRNDWKVFVENSKFNTNWPGNQGVGFSLIIKKEALEDHIQRIRKEGFPTYSLRPAGDRDIYTSIIYLEPFSDRNLRAFGYDMYSEPTRRKAMEQARDSDVEALSGKVILVQETNKDIQAGVLIYVPVYQKRKPTNTIQERREAILGWVYSPYRMDNLLNGILGARDLNEEDKIHLQIYDNETISQNSLLYDSRKKDTITFNISEQTITIPLVFNEKKWTLHFSKPIQNFAYFQSKVLIVLFSGLVISLLLFSLSLSLFNTRFRAQQIAEQLTLEIREDEHALILKNQEIQAQNENQKALNEKLSQRNNELIIAKAKIEESEDGFKNMFERHSAIMLLIEPLEGIILGANNAAVEFYGYSKSTLLTMNIYKINTLPPEEIKTLRKNTKDNNENSFTAPHKLANGEIRTVEVHSTPIKFQEKQILFSVIHDVTERKQSELALMESEIKLRELNITKDKFFSIIAHDLKSPFNSIIGFCNLLLDKIQNKDITNIDRYAQIIIQSSNKAMSLLMNLMEWSLSQTGRMSFNPEYFEMVALINETKLFYESIASQKSISIKTSLPPHIFISADKAMISTVLRNLISNAVKYTKSGGEISIAAVEKQNEIIFSISDTGVGISPKSLLKLFRIDQSYSTTGTNNEVGTGLGLILCKEFIEKHDGEIWAESEVGLGSTFYFSLPYNI